MREHGEGYTVSEGSTKTDRPRVVDLDEGTVAVLRKHKRARGSLALSLARDDALVLGTLENEHRHPERFSRLWSQTVARAASEGVGVLPIRLHDLRHTHATALLPLGAGLYITYWRGRPGAGHKSPR